MMLRWEEGSIRKQAKIVKYGGISETEALKLVTLNPAKILHLDDRMGSIKAGKDADLVLWTDNPLSVYHVQARQWSMVYSILMKKLTNN